MNFVVERKVRNKSYVTFNRFKKIENDKISFLLTQYMLHLFAYDYLLNAITLRLMVQSENSKIMSQQTQCEITGCCNVDTVPK